MVNSKNLDYKEMLECPQDTIDFQRSTKTMSFSCVKMTYGASQRPGEMPGD